MVVRGSVEGLSEFAAASRLGVAVGAWRWAVATGVVPSADAGEGSWSRAVVERADVEGVRAGLVSVSAFEAAERLTAALGTPLPPLRPAVTGRMIGDLTGAGILLRLEGPRETPVVHADQVAALTRRRDLAALLDRHTLLGPDQSAVRLGLRRSDVDHLVRLAMLRPTRTGFVDYGRARGGAVEVSLYRGLDVALLPTLHPEIDWARLRSLGPGARSPLARLAPAPTGEVDVVTSADVARIAGVGRATVTAWRRRHDHFPGLAGGTTTTPAFDRGAVGAWLLDHDKITIPAPMAPAARLTLRTGEVVELYDAALFGEGEGARLIGRAEPAAAEHLACISSQSGGVELAEVEGLPGRGPFGAEGAVVTAGELVLGGRLRRVEVSWSGPVAGPRLWRHACPLAGPGGEGAGCSCEVAVCGGLLVDDAGCPLHGAQAGPPAMEHHRAGNIRCQELAVFWFAPPSADSGRVATWP
ncbi:hypothetical protein ACQEVM_37820 [Streptomyces sp. CA-243310]|uniref:hypothetical protein n=1 Tax=Streptomyces sp. CA-243310 TaxID=3240056 RepID=UPI003D8A9FEA